MPGHTWIDAWGPLESLCPAALRGAQAVARTFPVTLCSMREGCCQGHVLAGLTHPRTGHYSAPKRRTRGIQLLRRIDLDPRSIGGFPCRTALPVLGFHLHLRSTSRENCVAIARGHFPATKPAGRL